MKEKERLANIARASAWNKANRERRKEIKRRSYQANREKALAAGRKRYERNKEQINARNREWKVANKELVVEQSARRRWLKREGAEKISRAQLLALLKGQQGRCAYCERVLNEGKHLDHRIPLTRGGTHTLDNVVWSCPSCNLRKSRKLPDEFEPAYVCQHRRFMCESGALTIA